MIVFKKGTSLGKDNRKLCQFLDSVYDSSLIVDRNCNIINFGTGASQLNSDILQNYIGHNISEIDSSNPYHTVLETGTTVYGRLTKIADTTVLQSIYPIAIDGKIEGALALSRYYNLNLLQKQLLNYDHDSASVINTMVKKCKKNTPATNPIQLSFEELTTGDDIIEPLINGIYDSAIYVSKDSTILKCNMGQLSLTDEQVTEMLGQKISLFDHERLYSSVATDGKAIINFMSIVLGRLCINCIYPIYDPQTGEILGSMGTVRFSNIDKLRTLFASDSKDNDTVKAATARLETAYTFDDFLGNSPVTTRLIDTCKKVASTEHPVLITGETGTGKEVLAGAMHTANQKHSINPYIRLNCSAIPNHLIESELFGYKRGAFTGALKDKAGYFEIAANGTLLLDEIGDMDLNLQSKLLRALESRMFSRLGDTKEIPLNARIIASTNRDLYKMSMEGKFRADLYYRLNTVEITIPPLRERKEDIPLLISHFLLLNGENVGIRPDALELLTDYQWPGNVRELRNIINRICILYSGKSVCADDIRGFFKEADFFKAQGNNTDYPDSARQTSAIIPEICTLKEAEITLINAALREEHHNISNAAKILGITRATLYNKMKKYNIENH